ncbi:CBS domain-containing protein CBSX5 [Physcomitrium patens]|uniref:CBS domain-containing protein n=1 Tax=Physcomitrium patens TaxID=3218 RepID=A0A2K1K465_PHYPA|nr:CBS domain-containing protein CBSX5-like [Physcomitrium patens]XP_024383645.1 CBS domain-containing protein CBSX5-like [Physcomitrium patens]XP_024383646.1 CBS domain-containing protein CBSX5-like [Physcomitrium patens]PNR48565.1 hypothetical protein PHYPA_013042 [Physcomitrium patens]|eukprot:XP_024383644.1 CBS domain-containing protein CBSX5-like [Physcomitrella patens]
MAGFFHARQAGDLAVGKPPLHKYPKNLSVGEALRALKKSSDLELSLWEELCPLTEKPKQEAAPLAHGTAWKGHRHVSSDHALGNGTDSNGYKVFSQGLWRCVGKLSMVDITCFLARDESLADPSAALRTPVSAIVSESAFTIVHVDSKSKLFDALAHVLDGVHHLVVSIDQSVSNRLARYNSMPRSARVAHHAILKPNEGKFLDSRFSLPTKIQAEGPQEYCWLTPEDILQFLLSCISLFSPLPMMTIQQLGIINMDVLSVKSDADVITALPLIQQAARNMTAVAVVEVEEENVVDLKLVGEISPFTMKGCDEKAALALATLSVRDFLAFSCDCECPPNSLVERVESRICEKLEHLQVSRTESLLADTDSPPLFASSPVGSVSSVGPLASMYSFDSGEESSSSDEDCIGHSPTGPFGSSHRSSYSYYKGRLAPNMCRPWSSLVAVMVQALTHRVGYIWVTDSDNTLIGIVTYLDLIRCILSHLHSSD